MRIFTILYGSYYPPHGEFELICMGKFSRQTSVNFTQQYAVNRQRCQQNIFYYALWQLLLYFYREFPSKILSVYISLFQILNSPHFIQWITLYTSVIWSLFKIIGLGFLNKFQRLELERIFQWTRWAIIYSDWIHEFLIRLKKRHKMSNNYY